ncbi:hypothetical protein ADL03_00065 [Nocardia sp. NRRL S-836]|nr:hypothetical protein ADL03_00065 [Nocardia sp. NRRL S-836]
MILQQPERPVVPPPQQLPRPSTTFVNRLQTLAALDTCTATDGAGALCTIEGAPGVGKTALVVHWAHQRRDRFPDGILYVNLRGHEDATSPASPDEVLDGFLDALGLLDPAVSRTLEAKTSLYRSALHSKKMLVVLDDAVSAEQVRPLLPGVSQTPVLITSRTRLTGLHTREGAVSVDIAPLPAGEAVELLRRTIGESAVDAEIAAARELAELCSCLPLPLRIAADRVAGHTYLTITDLVADLRNERDRLDLLDSDDPATAVRTVFSVSYRSLPHAEARMFRLLGLHPGSRFSLTTAAVLTGLRPVQLRKSLDVLCKANLVERLQADRYRLHDLIRVYAAECAEADEPAPDRQRAQRDVLTWYLSSAANADRVLTPFRRRVPVDVSGGLEFASADAALDWCVQEQPGLAAAVRLASALAEHDLAWRLAAVLWGFYYQRKPWADWIGTHRTALSSATCLEDPFATATIAGGLAVAERELRRYEEAESLFTRALDIWTSLGDTYGEAWVCNGFSQMCRELGRGEEATVLARRSLEAWTRLGDRYGQGMALNSLSGILSQSGDLDAALTASNQAVAAFSGVADAYSKAWALNNLANVRRARGELVEAVNIYERVLVERRTIGDHYGRGFTLRSLGETLLELGRVDDATAVLGSALEYFEQLDDPTAADVRRLLESKKTSAEGR